jgi:N-acetylmuramoyl-L-alanine amidase
MFKIALSAGHGRNTAGKRCMKKLDPSETREWVLNSRIVEKVEQLLAGYEGVEVLRLDDRTGDTDVALKTRSKSANAWGADLYLAGHHNGGVWGGKGGGIVAYVYTKPSEKSLVWQKALYDALIAATGLRGNRSKPLARKNLHEVREPKMPAVLLELGFMDSQTDVPIILTEEYAAKCAKAIVETLARLKNLEKKESGEKPAVTNRLDFAKECHEEAKGTYWVNSHDGVLNLRAGAGADKPIIEAMPTGSTVKCYGYHTGNWLYVVSEAGNIGFCNGGYLEKI